MEITAIDGSQLEVLQDFKYPGSMMSSTEADIKARKEWHGEHAIKWTRSGSQT